MGRHRAVAGCCSNERTRRRRRGGPVLARSAGVGENLKRVCHCDGTVIFESTPDDFEPSSA